MGISSPERRSISGIQYRESQVPRRSEHDDAQARQPGWTFLSNHAHVVVCIVRDPDIRLRDIAASVGITERAAQRIVSDLAAAGYLERQRTGRRNRYRVHLERPLRHPLESESALGAIISGLARTPE